MNEVLEKMKSRRSIRSYQPDAVPQELLDQIIEAGLYAASGKGTQNTIILQVTNQELRDEIAKKNCEIGGWQEGFDPFYGAPAILIVLGKKADTCLRRQPCYGQFDAGCTRAGTRQLLDSSCQRGI